MSCLRKIIISILVLATSFLQAEVKVNKMFSDHMVLQRNMKVPIWGTAASGEKVTVSFRSQSVEATTGADKKWSVRLEPLKVGDAAELTVKGSNTVIFKDVLVGEVWIGSGQSNMAGGVRGYAKKDKVLAKWAAGGPYPNLRLFKGSWNVAETKTIEAFSALHFSFGFRLHQELKVPVGLMVGAVGGTPSGRWLSPEMANADAALLKALGGSFETIKKKHQADMVKWMEASKKAKAEGKKAPRKPRGHINIGDLYARNIAYMVPYGIRGVLWDQGESKTALPNVDQFTTMNALITGWRTTWGQGDFHFLHVQKPSGGRAAFDAANPINLKAVSFSTKYPTIVSNPMSLNYQLNHIRIAKIKNAPLVTACDLAPGIHPPTKSSYGHRAARVALGSVYDKDVAICGPVYKSHKVEGSTVRVSFDHVGKGLTFKHAETVRGFAVAGADGKWAWAEAKIDGDTIVLSSKDVSSPTQVQYAFNKRSQYANLYNKDGLPALMFITSSETK
jgi:sialate O-acetylesterase